MGNRKWDKEEVEKAAQEATVLSALLDRENFYKEDGLNRLRCSHLQRFLCALDDEEAGKLRQYAEGWHYTNEPYTTSGLPLLEALWSLEPLQGDEPDGPRHDDRRLTGRDVVLTLARHEPEWVGRWWEWRCKRETQGTDLLTNAMIRALSPEDAERYISDVDANVLLTLVRTNPTLLRGIPAAQRGRILSLALDDTSNNPEVIESLLRSGWPYNAMYVIDEILAHGDRPSHCEVLENLHKRLEKIGLRGPAAIAVEQRHPGLLALLRSPWHETTHPYATQKDYKGNVNLWERGPERLSRFFMALVSANPDPFRVELGYSVAMKRVDGQDPTEESVFETVRRLGIDNPPAALVRAVLPAADLWATLHTLAQYENDSWKHATELVGLRTKVASIGAAHPVLWAEALPWILVRANALGSVAESVTLELAASSTHVRQALEAACEDAAEHVRLRARGLWALFNGLEGPEVGLARTLADVAALHMDGTPVFPHPLEPMSATWLGSLGIESVLVDGVRRAAERFAGEIRDQGADVEEALTKALVKEIESEFRSVRPRLHLIGRSISRSQTPVISVRQRPISKKTEEPVYGCDIAWLLDADVRGRYRMTWVEIVQVKKSLAIPLRFNKKLRVDSWKIKIKQLSDILEWSATATYWLIASAGEILVIPARHLLAIERGTRKKTPRETFTVGYHEVRSAAIPLEQYLPNLLIGQWVGTSTESVVRLARGEDSAIRPRVVVEVRISVGIESDNICSSASPEVDQD